MSLKSLVLLEGIETKSKIKVMADWHGIIGKNSDGDFDEEEVWSCEKDDLTHSSPTPRKPRDRSSSSSSAWRIQSAPKLNRRVNNSSSASHETEVTQLSSAPLNIPDWSEIYGKHGNMESSRNESWVDKGHDMVYEDGDYGGCGEDVDDEDYGDL